MKKFNCVLSDPPWSYADPSLNRGGALRHYSTMPTKDICKIPVKDIVADDAALFMWATFPKLDEAFSVIESWGFKYKTVAFVWVKTNNGAEVNQYRMLPEDQLDAFTGMGRWTRSCCEIVLLGTRGKIQRKSASVHQVVYAPVGKHSEKPTEVHRRIVELIGDVPRVELFARRAHKGWLTWGNEVESSVKL